MSSEERAGCRAEQRAEYLKASQSRSVQISTAAAHAWPVCQEPSLALTHWLPVSGQINVALFSPDSTERFHTLTPPPSHRDMSPGGLRSLQTQSRCVSCFCLSLLCEESWLGILRGNNHRKLTLSLCCPSDSVLSGDLSCTVW